MSTPNRPIDLTMTRTFPVPPEVVFAAWTDASQMARWWGTSEFPGSAAEIDLQVGGTWRACMTSPTGHEHWASGTFQTIDPPRKLAFSFAWAVYPDSVSDITIALVPHATGTEMTFHQRLAVSPETAVGYEAGWVETFERLTTYFALTLIS